MPSGKEPEGCKGSKRQDEKFKVRKVFCGKSVVPDYKTLTLASVIIPDFVKQEFLPSKKRNIISLRQKVWAETVSSQSKKHYIRIKINKNQT